MTAAVNNETFAQWDRRCKADMRRYRANLETVVNEFWSGLGRITELEGYFPQFHDTMVFVARWLWEPGLSNDEWLARLWGQAWEVDIQPWRDHTLNNLNEFWLGVDEHGNARRYFPRDRTRPVPCAYVCERGGVHVSYPLGDQPPAGAGWRPMTGRARFKWEGRLGWWRYPVGDA